MPMLAHVLHWMSCLLTLAVRWCAQRWRAYASLAYPATAMRCLAAWAVGGLTLAAGLLPDPDSAVASVAVASNLYVSTLAMYSWRPLHPVWQKMSWISIVDVFDFVDCRAQTVLCMPFDAVGIAACARCGS